MSTLRESSKETFLSIGSIDHINAGSLQRIADATEKLAINWDLLMGERDRYKKWYYNSQEEIKRKDATIRGLRGEVTKLMNRIESESK